MNLKKLVCILFLTTTAGLAHAGADINLGTKYGTDEYPRLSIRQDDQTIRVRVKVEGEAVCSRYRKDLCGIEDKVSLLELTLAPEQCHIESPTLLACEIDSFVLKPSVVSVILKDGTTRVLRETAGYVRMNHLSTIDFEGKVIEQNLIDVEVWGNRADGLDPLIKSFKGGMFAEPPSLQEISTSLF